MSIEWPNEKYSKSVLIKYHLDSLDVRFRIAEYPTFELSISVYGIYRNLDKEDKKLLKELIENDSD